jgi:hypothetical protein
MEAIPTEKRSERRMAEGSARGHDVGGVERGKELAGKAMERLESAGKGEARLALQVPAGRGSAGAVRPALAELVADADPVVIEQIAVLAGALTSGSEREELSAPFELEVRAEPGTVTVVLRDPDFARHRSDGDLVSLDRSMLTGWRLRLLERLADRWSVSNDGGLTLRFELDTRDRPDGDRERIEPLPDVATPMRSSATPVGGPISIRRSTRSKDGPRHNGRPESLGVDHE